jgi:hypothetical protein
MIPSGSCNVVTRNGEVAAFTFSVAATLVTLPAALLTTTLKVEPLSVVDVAEVVKLAEAAPLMATPFFCHW